MRFLNVYAVTRHFGGPEEGGWWYNAGDPLASVPLEDEESESEENRKKLVAKYEKMFEDEKWGDIHHSTGGVDVQVRFEKEIAQYWPQTRPHYE